LRHTALDESVAREHRWRELAQPSLLERRDHFLAGRRALPAANQR
jgi:hypothetical protein